MTMTPEEAIDAATGTLGKETFQAREEARKAAVKAWGDQMDELAQGGGPWVASNGNRPIVPVPEEKPKEGKRTVHRNGKVVVGTIGQSKRAINPGDLHYGGDPTKGVESVSLNGEEITFITYKADDIVDLARAIQIQQIKDRVTKDVEADSVDHLTMAKDLLTPSSDEAVQILDGSEHPDFSFFPGNSAESLRITINYIESMNLQETAPWSAIWNLWKCLEAVSHDKTVV